MEALPGIQSMTIEEARQRSILNMDQDKMLQVVYAATAAANPKDVLVQRAKKKKQL